MAAGCRRFGTPAAHQTLDHSAIRLSRATLANVRVNIAIALGLKAAVLGLAGFGLSTLWMAVVADSGASVLVVANAMRLLRHR